nr:hypothetical protein CFP56_78140 [Quercus suber]
MSKTRPLHSCSPQFLVQHKLKLHSDPALHRYFHGIAEISQSRSVCLAALLDLAGQTGRQKSRQGENQATASTELRLATAAAGQEHEGMHKLEQKDASCEQHSKVTLVSRSRRDKKLEFDDLETELKAMIVEKLIRPTDLKNVCLVNKQLHELAVKPLYRHIALDLGSPNDNRLSAFLSPRNIGLQHIKRIRLYLATVPDRRNQKQQADFATRMLLEFLPENVLEEFSWCPWEPFSTDNLILLYKRQRKMKWLEVMDLDRPNALQEMKKTPKLTEDLFKTARKLALYPENRLTMDLCQFYVTNTANVLEELIVHANFDTSDFTGNEDSINPRDLNDNATAPGLISSTIFSHMMPFEKCEPFQNLKSLRLHRISLRYCADTWCKFVDFTRIEQLRLYQCPGADSLFGQLCKASNLPKQLKTLEVQHKDNTENEALIALDGFLCLVSGLRDLVIDMEHVKALPAAAGIAKHGKTLEMLNVHCSPEFEMPNGRDHDQDELAWESEQFEKICKACTALEQLSCAWPEVNIIESPDASPVWTSFERSFAGLRNLVTLHISTWPMNKTTHSNALVPRSIYEQLMSTVAQRLFEVAAGTHPSSVTAVVSNNEGNVEERKAAEANEIVAECRLRLIGFGISEKIYEREDSKNQILFLRSTALDCVGKPKIHATTIGWCLRQYVEPRSEVLDFVLHRNSRPPCRDPNGTGWPTLDDDE